MEMARHGPMRHFVASVKASDFVLSLAIICDRTGNYFAHTCKIQSIIF
jgi:hypothetical protein